MTGQPAPGTSPERLRPLEQFTRACEAVWATTYNLDLPLVNEFLLPQLGDPPLNLTVLADAARLADTLARVRDPAALAAVNRRWLLRGVRYGTGAFHPKSYLFVTPTGATLLVGSGNLSGSGLADGKETFTRFRTGTAAGNATVGAWLAWLRRLVEAQDDLRLAQRFADLSARLPNLDAEPAGEPDTASPLLHNLDRALGPQLLDRVGPRADEVLLTAPFYDAHGDAAGELVDALRPTQVHVFAAPRTQVDGAALASRLARSGAQVQVWRYEPVEFVHAKLIGVLTGDAGWLLSGSANLSHAALHRTPEDGGNVELGVVTRLPAADVRATFNPPEATVEPWPAAELAHLRFKPEPEPPRQPVTLHSVERRTASIVALRTTPAFDPDTHAWSLTDGNAHAPVHVGDGSAPAMADWPHPGRLVWLCDEQQTPLSDRAVIDEPASLTDVLQASTTGTTSDRPSELTLEDAASPLGALLTAYHRNLIMDVTDVQPPGGTEDPYEGEPTDEPDDLWERLEQEELTRDPRVGWYRSAAWVGSGERDPILDVLELLRAGAPPEATAASPVTAIVTFLNDAAARWHHGQADEQADDDTQRPVRRWPRSTRLRVRLRNVLRRWAGAQSDRRLLWIDPAAPLKNLRATLILLAALRESRHTDEALDRSPPACPLEPADLDDLAYRWFAAIVGTGGGDGWLPSLRPEDRDAALTAKDAVLTGTAAALCWLAIAPGRNQRARLIRWQPLIRAALDDGLLEPGEETRRLLNAVMGQHVDDDAVIDRLLACHDYIDDDLWLEHTAADLQLDHLSKEAPPTGSTLGTALRVGGIPDPLDDARIVQLLVAARSYFHRPGLVLFAADHTWRLAVSVNEPAILIEAVGADPHESVAPIDDQQLATFLEQGATLRRLFPDTAAA